MAAVLFGASAPAASKLAGDVNAFALAGLLYLGAGLAVFPATILRPRPDSHFAPVAVAWPSRCSSGAPSLPCSWPPV